MLTHHQVNNKSNTAGATCGAVTANPSDAHLNWVARSVMLCIVFCRSLFVPFRLVVVLSYAASGYPFCIFKLFCARSHFDILKIKICLIHR